MRAILILLLCFWNLFGAGELSSRRAPGFSLPDSSFKQHDPQDYRGKILLLEIMQTACDRCVTFSPILEEAAARHKDKVAVLSIVIPPDNQTTVARYIADHKVKSPVLFDCGQVTASYLKATPQNPNFHVPHLFIIDAQGMIRSDFGYEPGAREIFEGRGLFAELDRMLNPKR
jgi:peroxiredoxin